MKLLANLWHHPDQVEKIEYICGRIENVNVNGDGVALRRSFVDLDSKELYNTVVDCG